ncbi:MULTISPECIES: hypothetical protein [unclassified Arthrobacter]|uniref:hypothetical protein n=1 Tax=unclassified Arthrobacter TaxID=235627 RepID=UPI002E05C611|nr:MULTISPECIES: hypothetical protein [unclassified Arthrobacter]MEC5191575.1 hypothetical protein [Arthrobacter sp. MP_M4]MEC5203131.1 hypothetical protein [Arthrobacter sp. MP_M7]
MRWDALFADLETQLAASERLDLDAEITERTRTEAAAVELTDRLRGSVGQLIVVQLASGSALEGTLSHAGSQALVLDEPQHQVLVPYAAVVRYLGLSRLAVPELSKVRQRLGLASALRGLARDRAALAVLLAGGPAGETTLHGVIDRVGRDHLDLAVTGGGEDRRRANVRQMATIPFGALAGLRSARRPGSDGRRY